MARANAKGKKSKASGSQQPESNFIETVLNVRRVAKVIKGGRRFSFGSRLDVSQHKKPGFSIEAGLLSTSSTGASRQREQGHRR